MNARMSAHFDGELEWFDDDQDPELVASLADFEFMRAIIVGTLEHQAERVPEARFEQIWEAINATLTEAA